MNAQKTCKEKITERLKNRMKDIETLFRLYQNGNEDDDPELGRFEVYGLCFDYVSAGTFEHQRQGYFRYQLSTGGPSDEFRFFCDAAGALYKIEYWFLDWFDGARRILKNGHYDLMAEIFEDFREIGMIDRELETARERM